MNHSTNKEAFYQFLLNEQAKKIQALNTQLLLQKHNEHNQSVVVSEEHSYDTHPSTPSQSSKVFTLQETQCSQYLFNEMHRVAEDEFERGAHSCLYYQSVQ